MLLTICALVLLLGLGSWVHARGNLVSLAVSSSMVVLMVINLRVLRQSRTATFSGVFVCVLLLVILTVATLGGLHGFPYQYFAAVPLLAAFLVGPRLAVACAAVAVVELCVFDGLILGWLPYDELRSRLGSIFLTMMVGALAALVESVRDRAERERDEAQARLLDVLRDRAAAQERHAAELERSNQELARSNQELEQFAYVASHDLQEPLRMVASYTQLLSRRYQGKLDATADEFIGYSVDGALRMQRLIQDLLTYARVGTKGDALGPVDAGKVLQQVLASLEVSIREQAAEVSFEPLPWVHADESQLGQLLQNLVGNALKFRSPERPPHIHVSARQQGGEWVFAVQDDGIGIEPQYFERIFVIFQRLQAKTDYPGTGIGLAVCKRIVERHGGRIWVESRVGQGTTFFFTLRPASPPLAVRSTS